MTKSSADAAELPISDGTPRAVSGVVESFDATRIHYDLYDAPSRSLVVVVPGFWRFRRHPSMIGLASLLTGKGYRVAVVDVRGHGDSEGTYGFNLNEHYDVYAVTRHLLQKCAAESVSLIGLSYGGAISISTAARHRDLPVSSLVLISPVADFAMIMPRINPFTFHKHIAWGQALHRPRFDWRLRGSAKLRALDDVADVHAPVCLIHVKNDWLIGHTHSEALYAAANEPKELHVIDMPGNYHADRVLSVAAAEVEPMILNFLEKYA